MRCAILLTEPIGISRFKEYVRMGVPFTRSLVKDISQLSIIDQDEGRLSFQGSVLERWPDRSLKWLLIDCLVDIESNTEKRIQVEVAPAGSEFSSSALHGPRLREEKNHIVVDTGKVVFTLSTGEGLFDEIVVNGNQFLSQDNNQLCLIGEGGSLFTVVQSDLVVEEVGDICCTLKKDIRLVDKKSGKRCNATIRYRFIGESGLVRMEVSLHNPSAACHPGGLWDLGDKGSVSFQDFSLKLRMVESCKGVEYQVERGEQSVYEELNSLILHQNSSGRDNWNSPNHVNKDGVETVSFKGYSLDAEKKDGETIHRDGMMASPWIRLNGGASWISVSVDGFWQNFPKTLRIQQNTLQVALFPSEQGYLFELQGGERKRHLVWMELGCDGDNNSMSQLQSPIQWRLAPEWIANTGVVSHFTAQMDESLGGYCKYIGNIVSGKHSFFAKRDIIDEYGWRNFGDLYADHEAVNHVDTVEPFISHYNNQYDFIYGGCLHYLQSGDSRWWELAETAALHMIDIDIYHTEEDRPVYNGGLFWHTDHYKPACTATHRAYSRKNKVGGDYGGGTSNEHIYTSGLCLYYYLTGDVEVRNSVITLAEYVLAMDDGKCSILCLFDENATGMASKTVEPDYHHPGRGAGNSINCLIDAYRLSGVRRYFDKAEELIKRCIHPSDNVESLKLDEPEYRWSYLVFLQVLGKYLAYKLELGERDYTFFYARDSLLTYAAWMKEHEVPYNDVLDRVLIPTETWPAQDIRKAHVFFLAGEYGPDAVREVYRERARFFFERSLDDLLQYKTAFLARPLVLQCVYGFAVAYFLQVNPEVEYTEHNYDFGAPVGFVPQRSAFKANFSKKLKATWQAFFKVLSAKYAFLR